MSHKIKGKGLNDALGDFSKCTPFLAEVDNHTDATLLRTTNAFLDRVSQVGFAGANVRAEDIRSIACIAGAGGYSSEI